MILTLRTPDNVPINWNILKAEILSALYDRYNLNDLACGKTIEDFLVDAIKLKHLAEFISGSDWCRDYKMIGDLKIIKAE